MKIFEASDCAGTLKMRGKNPYKDSFTAIHFGSQKFNALKEKNLVLKRYEKFRFYCFKIYIIYER